MYTVEDSTPEASFLCRPLQLSPILPLSNLQTPKSKYLGLLHPPPNTEGSTYTSGQHCSHNSHSAVNYGQTIKPTCSYCTIAHAHSPPITRRKLAKPARLLHNNVLIRTLRVWLPVCEQSVCVNSLYVCLYECRELIHCSISGNRNKA